MYTLSSNEISQVSGGCPLCAMTTVCAAIGASGVAVGLPTNQIVLLAASGILLTFSLVYSIYHTNNAWFDFSAFSS